VDVTLLTTVLSILYSEFNGDRLFEMVRCSHFNIPNININQSFDHGIMYSNPLEVL